MVASGFASILDGHSLVQPVVTNVTGNGVGQKVAGAVACSETLTQIGGGDIVVHVFEQVDAALLFFSKPEFCEVVEWVAGAADDNPFGQREQASILVPFADAQKAVGADEAIEGRVRSLLEEERERIDGVVWCAVGLWLVDGGGGKTRQALAGVLS
jgi:hypothetical protein